MAIKIKHYLNVLQGKKDNVSGMLSDTKHENVRSFDICLDLTFYGKVLVMKDKKNQSANEIELFIKLIQS